MRWKPLLRRAAVMEAGTACGISVYRLRQWMADGTLPKIFVRADARAYYRSADLAALVAGSAVAMARDDDGGGRGRQRGLTDGHALEDRGPQ